MPICSSIFSSLTDDHIIAVDGHRAVFIAQNGIDLLRVLAGDKAQRIAVVAADAVSDVASFAIADADHFAAGEIAADDFDPFGNSELPLSRIAWVAPASTVISPAGGAPKIQRLRFSSAETPGRGSRYLPAGLPSHGR